MTENMINTVKIKRIINECEGTKTIIFNINSEENNKTPTPKPGQFVMIWVPGVDEIPMSISGYDDLGNWGITVKNVGECTSALHKLKLGDFIGVRGPLGNHFEIPRDASKQLILIGGGIGIAPIRCLALELNKRERQYTIIQGAKVADEIVFMDELHMYEERSVNVNFCTDDGSYGSRGFATEPFEKLIQSKSKEELTNIIAYTCGPEVMMHKLFQICETYGVKMYASLERIMRCGSGLCGLCALDPLGLLVCKDGPIFDSDTLRKMEDFGKFSRDFTGKKNKIE